MSKNIGGQMVLTFGLEEGRGRYCLHAARSALVGGERPLIRGVLNRTLRADPRMLMRQSLSAPSTHSPS